MLKYLFLGLFCLTSLIHLYHSYINDKKNRAKTKPFLLIFLILYYITAAKNVNAMLLAASFPLMAMAASLRHAS